MNAQMNDLMEFREIIFWQQLNKQMIELKEKGRPVSEENQDALQKFCFENKLFETITSNAILDDIPVAMVADFSGINFLTLNAVSWNRCLERIVPNSVILNIERALADAFDVITDYDKKHRLFKPEPDEDDDELYAFISRYDSMLPEEYRDLNGLLQDLYGFKANALSEIFTRDKPPRIIRYEDNEIIFDLRSLDSAQEIKRIYDELFRKKSSARIENITNAASALKDMDLLGLFETTESAPGQKTSIKDFIAHEGDLYLRRQKLLKEFRQLLTAMENLPHDLHISICDLGPFFFLKSPFPLV